MLLDVLFIVLELMQNVAFGVVVASSISTAVFLYFGIRFFLRSSVMEAWHDARMPLAEKLAIARDNALVGMDRF